MILPQVHDILRSRRLEVSLFSKDMNFEEHHDYERFRIPHKHRVSFIPTNFPLVSKLSGNLHFLLATAGDQLTLFFFAVYTRSYHVVMKDYTPEF